MKQKITILSLLICTWISVQAYEVFEHNQGDESHLIRKSKVMNGRYATIWDQFGDAYGDLCIEFDDGMLEVYDEHYRFFNGEFYSKEGDIAIISPTSIHILRMEDPATSEYNLSLKIEYNLVGGKKVYTIHLQNTATNIDATVKGRPIFHKSKFGSETLIGSETTQGRIPVFLEWLEHQLKKEKFKIIYKSN